MNQTQKVIRKASVKSPDSYSPVDNPVYRPNIWSQPLDILSIPSSTLNASVSRGQLFGSFLSRYLPSNDRGTLTTHYAFLERIRKLQVDTELLRTTIETICLAELGSVFGDQRCLEESRKRYTHALSQLAKELNSHSFVKRKARIDEVLASISLFVFCEFYSAIGLGVSNQSGCISHVNGANRYIESIGPEAVSSEFGVLIFHKQRSQSLSTALINRKVIMYGRSEWLEWSKRMGPGDKYMRLYDVLATVPGFLEGSDSIETRDLGLILDPVRRLILDLNLALEECRACGNEGGYRVVDVRQFEMFFGLCPDLLFQTVFDFDSVAMCISHQHCWTASILLHLLLLDIYHSTTPETEWITNEDIATTRRNLIVIATDFCRTIPFCYQPAIGSVARIGPYICCVVENFFQAFGYAEELRWIQLVRELFEEGQPDRSTSSSPSDVFDGQEHGADTAGRGTYRTYNQSNGQVVTVRKGVTRMIYLDEKNLEWKRHHDSMIGYKIVSSNLDAGLRLRYSPEVYNSGV